MNICSNRRTLTSLFSLADVIILASGILAFDKQCESLDDWVILASGVLTFDKQCESLDDSVMLV